jgi:hypothetical protein
MFESLLRISRSVRRTGSGKYLLLMLVSFACSVTFTRAFLNLTGFPKIGSGSLHIAHVLWGGLFLYAATILPLLFANRWVYPGSAILSGIGIGLFIDEVGKFITANNDYFFPQAAPIIYSFFVISAILYARIRRNRINDPRSLLYKSFDMLEEILEHEMDKSEKDELLELLEKIQAISIDVEYKQLAQSLHKFVEKGHVKTINKKILLTDRIQDFIDAFISKYCTRRILRYFTGISVLLLGIFNMIYPTRFFFALPHAERLPSLVSSYLQMNLITSHSSLDWLTARMALQIMVGLILSGSAILILLNRPRQGLPFAFLGMLLMLTTLDLLIFYYDQFSTIAYVAIQVVIFLAIQQYRQLIKNEVE